MIDGAGTRASLILRLGNQSDDSAWTEFLEIYEPMLFRLASRWGMQDADAREVVQETLIAVARAVGDFESKRNVSGNDRPGAFRAWLATITRNKLADHLKRRAKQERGSGDSDVQRWLGEQACETSSASVWDWQQKQEIFRWAADRVKGQVSDATWQAFYRTSVQDQSVREVAEQLGMQEGMVYVARSRVMVRLRKAVEAWTQAEESE